MQSTQHTLIHSFILNRSTNYRQKLCYLTFSAISRETLSPSSEAPSLKSLTHMNVWRFPDHFRSFQGLVFSGTFFSHMRLTHSRMQWAAAKCGQRMDDESSAFYLCNLYRDVSQDKYVIYRKQRRVEKRNPDQCAQRQRTRQLGSGEYSSPFCLLLLQVSSSLLLQDVSQ